MNWMSACSALKGLSLRRRDAQAITLVLLKLYIYGHLNRIPSSRRLEREALRRQSKQCVDSS
jgi:hypothetical protein